MSALLRPVPGPRPLRRTADGSTFTPTRFALRPAGATIGAWVDGVDLRGPVDDPTFLELRACLAEWKVLLWRDQDLRLDQHAAFAARWGTLVDDHLDLGRAERDVDNVVVFHRDAETLAYENGWHSDGTFRPMPTAGTMLRAIEVPPAGGDTLWCDAAAALDALPADVQARLVGRRARHDWSLGAYATKYGDRLAELRAAHPPVEHPVVVRHPLTRRPTLFVNPLFTDTIVGVEQAEADELLGQCWHQLDVPEHQLRLHWEPGTVALWDNLASQHYAANDYFPHRRVMARATFFSTAFDHLEPWDGRHP